MALRVVRDLVFFHNIGPFTFLVDNLAILICLLLTKHCLVLVVPLLPFDVVVLDLEDLLESALQHVLLFVVKTVELFVDQHLLRDKVLLSAL